MFEKTGIASFEMVMSKFPSAERINKGKVAVAECYKCIPCNPCEDACGFNAIKVGEDINQMPVVDPDACIGCGRCVSRCPGLAIILVDGSISEESGDIYMPYEFLPLPEKGETVKALDRAGKHVCDGTVIAVANKASNDRTPVIRVRVPRAELSHVRNIAPHGAAA